MRIFLWYNSLKERLFFLLYSFSIRLAEFSALHLDRKIHMPKKEIAPFIQDIRQAGMTYDEAVKRILDEYGIKKSPIPVDTIAQNLGFSLYTATFKDEEIAGVLADSDAPVKPFSDNRVMVINRNDYETRQRCTIAHEIGHFVLHCSNNERFFERYKHGYDRGQRPEIENNANAFGAALLMPRKMIIDFVDSFTSNDRNDIINGIAKEFNVSTKAAKRRLEELKI